MAEEQERVGKCGWIALGLVVFLASGLMSGGVVGGVAGIRTLSALLDGYAGSDLIVRGVVFVGMVLGLLLAAVIIMFLTSLAGRFVSLFFTRSVCSTLGRQRPKDDRASA